MSSVETIASLAMLKVNADAQGHDYLDYLVPFVCQIVGHQAGQAINVLDVRKGLREQFGLRLPAGPVELVLKRLARRRILANTSGVYVVGPKFKPDDFAVRRDSARASIERVVGSLIKFAAEVHGQAISETQAVNALTAYLGKFSIHFLSAFARGSALPVVPKKNDKMSYLVNSFIGDAYERQAKTFEDVVVLVKGHMLANALICPDLEGLQGNFGGTRFFLDTPFVLRLLGVVGLPAYEAAVELVDLLKRLRAELSVFNHTVVEVSQVLSHCERCLSDPNARAPIVMEMRKAGKSRSDVSLIRSRMDAFYGSHGISKWPAPRYGLEFQIDEAVLQEAITDEIAYFNPRAIDHDINSIRSIYALRSGLAPTRLENARAVFVTTNTRLARVAYRFGREHESMREVSSVITDFSLGNVAWLKAPLGSDLPRREIVATCYAAMQPPPKLWNRYLDEITKLRTLGEVSPADHEALRLSLIAREELMNLTLGEERAFSRQTVEQILETVRLEYTRKVTSELEEERKTRIATEQKVGGLEQQHDERRKRLFWSCARAGRFAGAAAMALVIPVVFAGALAATYGFGAYLPNVWLTSAATAAIGFFFLWSILDLIVGLTVKEAAGWISRTVHAALYRLVCRIEDIDPSGDPGA